MAALGLLLSGCAQTPLGPTVQVMPGPGKSFEAFTYDQAGCKQYATDTVAGQAQNANTRAVGAAAIGTVLGAGLGAAIGGGRGAAIGAGGGAVAGTGLGMGSSSNDQYGIQQQYDNAFAQCMYSKGNMVPGYGPMMVNAPPPPPSRARRQPHLRGADAVDPAGLYAPAGGRRLRSADQRGDQPVRERVGAAGGWLPLAAAPGQAAGDTVSGR